VPWRPFEPESDGFDWIQLKSGEWLKGSLKSMQDYSLEFDSEELDWQEFDWEDVHQVRSPRVHEVLLDGQGEGALYQDFLQLPRVGEILRFSDDRVRVEGPLHVTRDKVTVQGREGPIVFDRARLIAITPAGSREIDLWSGKISVGMTTLTGNTDSEGINITADLTRRTPATRLALDYLGAMEELEGVQSANNHRVTGVFDYWLSRRVYLRAPVLEYFSDPFSNVSRRVTGVVGLGYDIVHRQALEWDVFMGPGYQQTVFETVEAGADQSEDTMVVAVGTSAEVDITKRTDFNLSYTGQFVSEEAGGALHHTVATLEIDVTKVVDVDFSVVWDHVSHPQTAEDGTTPKKNDVRSTLSLGVEF
jgi:putative salt-induced outer membrane protein YdiY